MHQNYQRSPPPTASPASTPWTNPSRTNNPRDQAQTGRNRTLAGAEGSGEWAADDGQTAVASQQVSNSAEDAKKLNQVIQNYFYKAFLVIVHSRINPPSAYSRGLNAAKRVNRWFNIVLDETDAFREDMRPWKSGDHVDSQPAPLVIETYLDTADLTKNQVLVAVDESQKRWNVADALDSLSGSSRNNISPDKKTSVILERWQIDLDKTSIADPTKDISAILPVVYKRSIVLFRSLYFYARFLPAWKYSRKAKFPGQGNHAIRVRCRVLCGTGKRSEVDGLSVPLIPNGDQVTEEFTFGSTETPAGSFTIKVAYRTSCEFRVDDSDEILSSQFLGMEEPFFQPSLGSEHMPSFMMSTRGSLPVERRNFDRPPDRGQAYGSLSSFHQVGPAAGTSPLTALRDARDMMNGSPSSARDSQLNSPTTPYVPESTAGDARPGAPRRPSVSFKAFKSGSLSASPLQADQMMPPPTTTVKSSQAGAFNAAGHVRNRPSSGSIAPSSLRASMIAPENAIASSGSGSPRPAPISKYTSSFSNRKGRQSSGGASKTEDENSSGKASLASSAQRESGLLNEGAGASSESIIPTDADIEVFINMLDLKKNLKSFESPADAARAEASTKRTSAALSKFHKMRESNNALSESISSSLLLQRSSTSSSRQIASVPQMFGGASISTASSPGKPVSPHTPHTPAIPSRLSANQIAEYSNSLPRRSRTSYSRRRSARSRSPPTLATIRSEAPPPASPDTSTTAIDIPTSPRIYQTHIRRSSSVIADHRAPLPFSAADHIDPDASAPYIPYASRSASMGPQDRDPPSLSALLAMTDVDPLRSLPSTHHHPHSPAQASDEEDLEDDLDPSQSRPQRPSYRGRRGTLSTRPTQTRNSSYSSFEHHPGTSSSTQAPDQRPARPGGLWRPTSSSFRGAPTAAMARQDEDEDLAEPLLFAMSELGGGRRSLEEMRGGYVGGESAGSSGRASRRGGRENTTW
ncbi:MAG: autophagy protein 13 [Vezdaea aestivalis]|nr:MAG: autophagy protein 13 [Vezdaea aestivalis]